MDVNCEDCFLEQLYSRGIMTNKTLLMLKTMSYRSNKIIFKNWYSGIRKNHFDIAIAGGGLVGTSMACAVAKNTKLSDQKIILFESSPQKSISFKSNKDNYSNRVVSINPGSQKFLKSIGAWEFISDVRCKVVKKLQVWDACSDALITFNDELINDISYIVENDLIFYGLQQICQKLNDNITVKHESKIQKITVSNSKPLQLELENGDKYTCSLLIGADGANSKTRQIIGCQYLSWNYHQKGVVATLKLSESMENVVAWQRFLPTGPVALLPLTNELSSLVWSTETKKADELLRLSDESFVDAVNDAFWKPFPKSEIVKNMTNSINKLLESFLMNSNAVRQLPPSISSVMPKSRAAFPLGFGHSTKYIGPGIALIGDAAHRVHPLAGQGVNLGFGDVECLTAKLADSVYAGKKIGCPSTLAEYESERQKQILPMLAAIDVLQRLYSTSFTPVVVLRSLGLQITNALNPIKKKIVEQASA